MLSIGAASKVINNDVGRAIQGATVDNVAESIRDDCEANALYLSDGPTSVLLVSCDVAALESYVAQPAREAMAEAAGLPARSIIIAGTHMHSGPSLIRTNVLKPVDAEYIERLKGWLTELAAAAVANAQPGRIGWGLGSARVGYNRRCCWADGSHTMHGDTRREDFTGLEGADDPSHLALFAVDAEDKPIAVLYNNTTHTTTFYGANFYSADFPGVVRGYLRDALGESVTTLFLNGAFGDVALDDQLTKHHLKTDREQKMWRVAHLLTGETLRLMHEAEFHGDPTLGHAYEDLKVDVRLPAPARVKWARETLARVDAGQDTTAWDRVFAYGVTLLQDEFGDNPVDTIPVHVVRVGDVALATQPCELFCRFGLDIKRRSPAPLTGVVGIADGYGGYCPTAYGPLGGGYSGEPIHWTRLATDAGYRIVDCAARLLHQVWAEG